jgi:uncharacterized protein YndB with AHSA1/START domain
MSEPQFVPKTVYVTYIAATPEKVWAALTGAEFTRQYFFGRSVELEQRVGGSFILRMPDGRIDVQGRVVECDPPRKLSVTWRANGSRTCASCPSASSPMRSRRSTAPCALS